MLRKYIFCTLSAMLLLLAGGVVTAQEEADVNRTGFRLDAPTYGIRGPHAVGTIDMTMDDADRPLTMTIWYPALNPDKTDESYTYPVIYPPVFPPLEAYGMALFEAPPDTENGPYPLVVWSHGFTSFRTQNTYFGEHLASWGFVVIAPDHPGMTAADMANDPDTFWPMYYNAPLDVSRVIDFADDITADSALANMINTERIAASGHSSGGFIALQAAGAQIDLDTSLEQCDALENQNFDCPFITSNPGDLASLFGVDAASNEMLPSIADARIDTVISLAPDQFVFGDTGLNNVSIPTLYMVGTADFLYEDIAAGFPTLGSDTAYLIEFASGGHGLFQDTCERFPAMVEYGFYDYCAEKVWDKSRAHDLINHYAASFLLWQLKDDDTAAAIFGDTPDTFVGVNVTAK